MHSNLLLRKPTDSKLYVEDVFSTYLYTGTGASQTITNGIDLAGKGGLVWTKGRSSAYSNYLLDTARGTTKRLSSDLTDAEQTGTTHLTAFNSDGFSLGTNFTVNSSGQTYASWTFRKAPKFFDVVTWSGNDSSNRVIPHSLGTTPGFILIKNISVGHSWLAWHRSLAGNNVLALNETSAQFSSNGNVFSVNSTSFSVAVGSALTPASNYVSTNAGGTSYVAYLFAHDTAADGVIQCGSFTGNGLDAGPDINLGWEPQWLVVKRASGGTGGWELIDSMRGFVVGGSDAVLYANLSNAEAQSVRVSPRSTGFQINTTSTALNNSGDTYIYLAIRRGPMRVPTDATKVFNSVARTGTGATAQITSLSFPPDTVLIQRRNGVGDSGLYDKLRGSNIVLYPQYTLAEQSVVNYVNSFDQNGITLGNDTPNISGQTFINWFFRRAPGFFDVVGYTGTGVARTISHNLGVAPELMIVKSRSDALNWFVYTSATGNTKALYLEDTAAAATASIFWNNTSPTASVFTVGAGGGLNGNGSTFVAYLFASCPGVSKVGTYTGTGTTQQINCGFTNGARFVLIKRTDSTGDWTVWDTARGIVSGNDPYLLLNSTAAEVTNTDYIDPLSTGFEISSTAPAAINANGGTFVFLAIA